MNGVHDMGGLQDMGPVVIEKNEPVFHAPWEGRMYALNQAVRSWGKWSLDASRSAIESIAPTDYMTMSYYQKWYASMVELMVKTGMVARAEIESGRPAGGSAKAAPVLTADKVPAFVRNGVNFSRDIAVAPRFKAGERVRARNINPLGHTRLPRYARGKTGTVERDYGVFVFPDTNAHFLGEKPQRLYSVRFAARELWGNEAKPQDAVYLSMWDDYLEPV
jgi:nitrile hydratase subunit beta